MADADDVDVEELRRLLAGGAAALRKPEAGTAAITPPKARRKTGPEPAVGKKPAAARKRR